MRDSVWSAVQTPPPMYRGVEGGREGEREGEMRKVVRKRGGGRERWGIGRGVGETGWNG